MRCGLLLVGAALGIAFGCGSENSFACQSPADCGPDGTCGIDGYCAFPDPACPSGERYGDHAPPSVAGQCVPSVLPTSTSESSGGTSSPTTTTSTSTSTSTTTGSDTTSTTTSASSSDSGDETSTGTSESTGAQATVHTYVSAVAECVHETTLDPQVCGSVGTIEVDLFDSSLGEPEASFLRFDFDGAFSGSEITSVTLRLTTGSEDTADQTGEVWIVEPFDFTMPLVAWPAQTTMLGADQGATGVTEIIEWDLDPQIVSPDSSLYLGVFPVDTDGVEYMRIGTILPPEIEIVTNP